LNDDLINSLLKLLDDEDPLIRIDSINNLGESADELSLKELRRKIKEMTPEYQALIIAIGKHKKKLGVK